MYKFYIIEINRAVDERQSQNVVAEKRLQHQITKAKDAKPLLENVGYNPNKVSFLYWISLFNKLSLGLVVPSIL